MSPDALRPVGSPDGCENATVPLFAREVFQRVAGETLRPGGLTLTRRALGLAGLEPGMLALDLGCGRGATARHLAKSGYRVLALDPSAQMLSEAKMLGNALQGNAGPSAVMTPVQGRAEHLPLPDSVLDAVFCECVLSVTGAAPAVLAETARTLKPGGVLVASDLFLRGGVGVPGGTGDCRSGALPEVWLRAQLRECGLRLELFEDHSRLLAELAGQLVFAGMSPAEVWGAGPERSKGQRCGPVCAVGARPGYFLCLARKGTV